MGKAVLLVLGVVLVVYAIFDLLATPKDQVRLLPKLVWFVVVFIPFAGALLWIFFGHANAVPPPKPRDTGGSNRPPGPRGPDDDPDYLRNL
ncbi:PLD nuclease N-terminal domain-containing protein [Aeromicrobium wangtongii]|nr:PLD nuclease N-terminal domain-containing protein [Aeromicrobium wangtongii]MCL3820242.1 PLD nuclease N-terminal domain-containing protein [Aeromicrobium wangtongii]